MTTPQNSIDTFKANFNGGTRANRFEVICDNFWPDNVDPKPTNSKFKIYATKMPAADIGTIAVPYRGRLLYLAGDRSYGSWTVEVYDDNENNSLWKGFNKWKHLIDGYDTHLVDEDDFDYSSLQKTWSLNQLDINGDILRTIKLIDCWPSQIGSLNFDMASSDQTVFSVVLTYNYYTIDKGI